MISLTYLSTATVSFGENDLGDLLSSSRERNQAAGLTGAMLYAGGHFIQTLEGPEEAVEALFDRIGRDERHRSIIVALREEIDTRVFPDWSMGFETLDEEEAGKLPGFNTYLTDGKVSVEDAALLGRPGIFHRVFRDNMR
jgi:hypothetical protein